jgi:hypothetical protein
MFKQTHLAFSSFFDHVNNFLDRYILPWPVRFLTFRFVILATICLLIPLILFANNTTLVLGLNSYLNTMSVAVSSIVLLYATIADAHQKQITEMQETRAQEDHLHVTEMHQLVLQTLENQNQEIEVLKQMISELKGQPYQPGQAASSIDLRSLHPLGDQRFSRNIIGEEWDENMVKNDLVSAIRKGLKPGSSK